LRFAQLCTQRDSGSGCAWRIERIAVDIVFLGPKVAVLVDGCFWHGCPTHATHPKSNTAYWLPKLEENKQRDRRQTGLLEQAGWTVVRVLGARLSAGKQNSFGTHRPRLREIDATQRRERKATMNGTAPEPGQLVEVRRRQWIVSDVDAAAVAPALPKRSLVKLTSIDEDALGEELEVLWELEPGASVIERAGLPTVTALDGPEELEAFLDAVRWGAATNADRGYLQAPFRSGVSIEDYQLDPLVRAIDMARTNLLIADDVGLGKTIEAGLVVQEMLLRHRARTVLVLCPASLQEKWRIEMDREVRPRLPYH
jgi:G:T-mismatch repair DNA endonuclease (very short patch repair protein)